MQFHNTYTGRTMDQIYGQLCKDLIVNGDKVGNTLELQNVMFTLTDPLKSLVTLRDTSIEYALGELVWYGNGDNSVEFIKHFGSMWERLSDDGVTNNSAYGDVIFNRHGFDQLQQVVEQLTVDPTSRRAVININVPNKNSIKTKDEPCTIALQYLLRDGKLHATTYMRSNDIWFGTPYDVLFFTTLQIKIAKMLDVELGDYTHHATSLHVYDRNITDIIKAWKSYPKYYSLDDLDLLIDTNISSIIYDKVKASTDKKEAILKYTSRYNINIKVNGDYI